MYKPLKMQPIGKEMKQNMDDTFNPYSNTEKL